MLLQNGALAENGRTGACHAKNSDLHICRKGHVRCKNGVTQAPQVSRDSQDRHAHRPPSGKCACHDFPICTLPCFRFRCAARFCFRGRFCVEQHFISVVPRCHLHACQVRFCFQSSLISEDGNNVNFWEYGSSCGRDEVLILYLSISPYHFVFFMAFPLTNRPCDVIMK